MDNREQMMQFLDTTSFETKAKGPIQDLRIRLESDNVTSEEFFRMIIKCSPYGLEGIKWSCEEGDKLLSIAIDDSLSEYKRAELVFYCYLSLPVTSNVYKNKYYFTAVIKKHPRKLLKLRSPVRTIENLSEEQRGWLYNLKNSNDWYWARKMELAPVLGFDRLSAQVFCNVDVPLSIAQFMELNTPGCVSNEVYNAIINIPNLSEVLMEETKEELCKILHVSPLVTQMFVEGCTLSLATLLDATS